MAKVVGMTTELDPDETPVPHRVRVVGPAGVGITAPDGKVYVSGEEIVGAPAKAVLGWIARGKVEPVPDDELETRDPVTEARTPKRRAKKRTKR